MNRRLNSLGLLSLPVVFALAAATSGCTGFVELPEELGLGGHIGGSSSSGMVHSSSSSSGMVSSGSSGTVGGSSSSSGMVSSGSSGTVGGSSSSSGSVGFGVPLGVTGYLVDAPWQGYAFTFDDAPAGGSTISPVCGANGCTPALTSLCANGVVAAQPDYSSFAGLGWMLNQTPLGEASPWTVSGSGVYIALSGTYPGARLQVDALDAVSGEQRYCADIPPGGGFIPFSNLMTYCWGDVSNPSVPLTVGTQVGHAAVLIPGTAMSSVPFDFCITALGVK